MIDEIFVSSLALDEFDGFLSTSLFEVHGYKEPYFTEQKKANTTCSYLVVYLLSTTCPPDAVTREEERGS